MTLRWSQEHARWSKRDLSAKRYGVDGIHVQARLEDAAQCLLVIIGATNLAAKYGVSRDTARKARDAVLSAMS